MGLSELAIIDSDEFDFLGSISYENERRRHGWCFPEIWLLKRGELRLKISAKRRHNRTSDILWYYGGEKRKLRNLKVISKKGALSANLAWNLIFLSQLHSLVPSHNSRSVILESVYLWRLLYSSTYTQLQCISTPVLCLPSTPIPSTIRSMYTRQTTIWEQYVIRSWEGKTARGPKSHSEKVSYMDPTDDFNLQANTIDCISIPK